MLELEFDLLLITIAWLFISTVVSFLTIFVKKPIKNFFGYFALAVYLIGSLSFFVISPNIFSLLLFFVTVYQSINITREIESRLMPKNLRAVSIKTFSWLLLIQSIIVICWSIFDLYEITFSLYAILMFIFSISLILGLTTFYIVFVWLERSEPDLIDLNDVSELPTVSLLIPARNEDSDLTECIEAALASNYPKLEILVLDDCSTDKTPEIIRRFAQNGVRFISGDMPQDTWLAKNQAYQKLADESSGEYLLFTGVDTRLQVNSITYAVKYMLKNQVDMISVMPKRGGQKMLGTLIQPMRYWLEFVGSKFFDNRPPVLSTCWLINAKSFKKLGQLKAVKNSVHPEDYFAKQLALKNRYYFVRSDNNFGVLTLKSIEQQIQTAIRTRYPSLNKRLELIPVLTLIYLIFFISPFIYVLIGWTFDFGILWMIAFLAVVALSIPHIVLTICSNPSTWILSLISFPIVNFIEIILMNVSMWKYEFSEVNWKDRNICLPVMEAIPNLPKIDEPARRSHLDLV